MDFRNRPDGRIAINTKDFTMDMQNSIVDRALNINNNNPSAYDMALARTQPAPVNAPVVDPNRVSLSKEEYESLLASGRMNTAQPNNNPQMNAQGTPQQTIQQVQQQPVNTQQPNNVQNDVSNPLSDIDRMMNDMGLGTGTTAPQVQQQTQLQAQQATAQPQQFQQQPQQQQVQPPQDTSFDKIQFDQTARANGVNPEEVMEFANNLTSADLINLYKSFQQTQNSTQQRPINLSEESGRQNVPTHNTYLPRTSGSKIF